MQTLVNALQSAAIVAPGAVAFTLVFTLFRYANFAVGGFITIGAFAAWVVNAHLGLPLWACAIVATLFGAAVFAAADRIVFEPLRARTGATLLLVSVALSFVLENVVRFFFGSGIRGFDLPLVGPMVIGGVRITRDGLWVMGVSLTAILAVGAILAFTPIGRAIRAVADNRSLAAVRGLPVGRVELVTLLLAGGLLGLSGTLVGVDLAIDPHLTWAVTIPVIAAAIFGGLGSPLGAAVGAVVIGLAEEITVASISPPYKGAVGFAVIALVLVFRPQGLLGAKVDRK
ncbi:amino acid ABC transporter LivHM family permease [Acuticoccus sediminis]|uniref:Amino acid ABC transporter LivHM family permease n=1 Tax=Acuticoccus sediminis TaxID=2184697 RepID=A0A8B2NTH4_9HYPH|nr:branched-chain amino acid ABC transporter permease [Acuticoccus sediminis]RAI02251.1 amino acid ABC transporter LivHM family permease [Acuticoccus sediminis]